MKLKSGYSYAVVSENIFALINATWPRNVAVAEAYKHARVCFFKRFPGGALPEWLAFPNRYRMREYYNADGSPNFGIRKNPAKPPRKDIASAKKLYSDFTGKRPGAVRKLAVKIPRAGLVFGKLVQVGYISARDGRPYRHTFRAKSRPLLIASSDGKSLVIVGGRYNFTERGIEDA